MTSYVVLEAEVKNRTEDMNIEDLIFKNETRTLLTETHPKSITTCPLLTLTKSEFLSWASCVTSDSINDTVAVNVTCPNESLRFRTKLKLPNINQSTEKMAIHIQSGKNNLDCNLKNSKIQSVPFKIHADCDAPISAYFEPYVKTCENEILTASFRGYPLKGKQIEIPEGYVGVVLHESLRPSREKDERKFYVVNKFKEITFWNWDKVPSKNDAFLKAMDWINIAEALHSPIPEE